MRTDISYLLKGNIDSTLRRHIKKFFPCKKCKLYRRKHRYVVYRGQLPCEILFIGEAPGHSEDDLGEPFIGRAGNILDTLILDSTDRTYPYTYGISNVVSCIPLNKDSTKFRQPKESEIESCQPRLLDLASRCEPALIVLLGKVAESSFPTQDVDTPIISLQHPAYILRQGGEGTVEYKRNLLELVEGIDTYGKKKKKKQFKKKVKQRSTKAKAKRDTVKKQKKKIKKRSRKN